MLAVPLRLCPGWPKLLEVSSALKRPLELHREAVYVMGKYCKFERGASTPPPPCPSQLPGICASVPRVCSAHTPGVLPWPWARAVGSGRVFFENTALLFCFL